MGEWKRKGSFFMFRIVTLEPPEILHFQKKFKKGPNTPDFFVPLTAKVNKIENENSLSNDRKKSTF